MVDKRALSLPKRLVQKHRTRDPFRIAEALGIEVLFRSDFRRQKGAFLVIERNSFLIVNASLSEEMQALVCAHELGHALLHRELGARPAGLLEFELFDITTQCEYEANVFAATLLLDDEELLEYAREGRDAVQIARAMGTNVDLILLKMNEMNKRGYDFRVPYVPPRGFLGGAEDGPGGL